MVEPDHLAGAARQHHVPRSEIADARLEKTLDDERNEPLDARLHDLAYERFRRLMQDTLVLARDGIREHLTLVRGRLDQCAIKRFDSLGLLNRRDELARQIDRAFGGLPMGVPLPLPPQWTPPTKPRTVVVERPVPQSTVLMAVPGIARDDPEWYAALVMNHVLGGGGQQSRLFNEVREKRGLAYGASSSLRTYKRAALLVMSTASANEKVAEAIRVIRAEMARLRNEGVTEAELTDAKTYLTGALALSLDSSGSIASLLHGLQIDGLSPDHLTRRGQLIAAVKLEDVRRVARRLLRDESLTTVVVGKPVGVVSEPKE